MLDTLSILPVSFWIVVALLLVGAGMAINRFKDGTGAPMIAVLVTIAAWYAGDALYNDYSVNHSDKFTSDVLQSAWVQVAWFLAAFMALVPVVHQQINREHAHLRSQVVQIWAKGVGDPKFQGHLIQLFYGCLGLWVILAAIAFIRLEDEIPYYFFPFLGYKAEPWGRGRVGGQLDALLSLAAYFQHFVAGAFGLMAALVRRRWVILLSLLGCVMTWPYYLFDRTRNTMLAIVLPAVLAWVFLRYRGGLFNRALILLASFVLVNAWFAFVLENRTDSSIANAFNEKGFSLSQKEEFRHQGLNMFEELCWINTFIEDGSYKPNWGTRYFAELVNPIPRGLWPGKPFVGLDYAKVRGHADDNDEDGGVNTTISTGMIGQGVVNFGLFFGPAFAALLMSVWVAILARLDLTGDRVGHIPLYAFSLILTFNLGRDVTFLTLYSFVFGWVLVRYLERAARKRQPQQVMLANR